MTQLTLPGPEQLVRKLDPVTSILAAARAAKSSSRLVRLLARALLAREHPIVGTDEELCGLLHRRGDLCSQSAVRHARKILSDAGLLVDSGVTRMTRDGGAARVWEHAGQDADGLRAVAEGLAP